MKRLSLLFFLTGLFLTLCVMPNFAQAEDSTNQSYSITFSLETAKEMGINTSAKGVVVEKVGSDDFVTYTSNNENTISFLQYYAIERQRGLDPSQAMQTSINYLKQRLEDNLSSYKGTEMYDQMYKAAVDDTLAAVGTELKGVIQLDQKQDSENTQQDNSQEESPEQQQAPQTTDNEQEQNKTPNEIPGVDQEEGKAGDATDQIGNEGNADGSTGIKGVCADAGSGDTKVFAQIACKVMMFLIDLRVIAYIISGFGMVMFAYAAVFNKINWKHFASIAIGLFLLAMIGPFVSYFTGDTTVEANLQYGNYLGGRYQGIEGTGNDISDSDVPNTNVETKKKWGFSDLVGSVKSGINMARSAYNTYQTAKSAINTVKNNVDIIKNSIANSGGGLDGILGAIGNTAGALNNIGFAVSTGVGNTLAGIGNTANNMQDTFTDNAGRTENAQQRADGGSSNLVSQWLNSEQGGAGLTNTVSDLNNIINKGATVAGAATTVAHEGQNIGGGGAFGDILGGLMGAGQALVSGADMSQQLQQEKQLEQQRQQQMQQQQQQQQQAASQPLYNSLFDTPSSSTTQKSNSTSTSTSTTSTGNTRTNNAPTNNTPTNTTQTNNTPTNNAPTNNTSTQTSAATSQNQQNMVTWTDSSGQTHYGTVVNNTFSLDDKGNGVYTTSNGTVTYNKDGSKIIKTNSGKEATINKDGSKVVKDTNTGVEVHMSADGKMWRIDAAGNKQELDPNSSLGKQIQKL